MKTIKMLTALLVLFCTITAFAQDPTDTKNKPAETTAQAESQRSPE